MTAMKDSSAPRNVFGYTVFCDDIRHELGGKVSLIGVYAGRMFVHAAFPFRPPRLGLAISYFEKRGACSGPVTLNVYFPADDPAEPALVAELPVEAVRTQAQRMTGTIAAADGADGGEYLRLDSHLLLETPTIRQPGYIRVVGLCEGDEACRLGELHVVAAPIDGKSQVTRKASPSSPQRGPAARRKQDT